MSSRPPDLFFDYISAEDVKSAHDIEVAVFPADEAASLEQFQQRQTQAPKLFLGVYTNENGNRKLIGYVCSTLSASETLTLESMSKHDPTGTSVCTHAVCVSQAYQRRGIAKALLREYIKRLELEGRYNRLLLICHLELRQLYESVGFEWVGASAVVHGPKAWFEMKKVFQNSLDLENNPPQNATTLPPGLWEALQRSTRNRPSAKLLKSFPSIDDLVDISNEDGKAVKQNRFDLLCPREGCGCVILKSGVGCINETVVLDLEPTDHAPESLLPVLPPIGEKILCWLVRPNAMAFENAGFSKSLAQTPEGPRIKVIICADCDLGPLGWCFEGDSNFWLFCNRVGYRV